MSDCTYVTWNYRNLVTDSSVGIRLRMGIRLRNSSSRLQVEWSSKKNLFSVFGFVCRWERATPPAAATMSRTMAGVGYQEERKRCYKQTMTERSVGRKRCQDTEMSRERCVTRKTSQKKTCHKKGVTWEGSAKTKGCQEQKMSRKNENKNTDNRKNQKHKKQRKKCHATEMSRDCFPTTVGLLHKPLNLYAVSYSLYMLIFEPSTPGLWAQYFLWPYKRNTRVSSRDVAKRGRTPTVYNWKFVVQYDLKWFEGLANFGKNELVFILFQQIRSGFDVDPRAWLRLTV